MLNPNSVSFPVLTQYHLNGAMYGIIQGSRLGVKLRKTMVLQYRKGIIGAVTGGGRGRSFTLVR